MPWSSRTGLPKERYFDPDFYQLEVELLWPRVWQMACRLEEIPEPDDFVEYEILDQSVIVVRTDDLGVRAFQNACRHRGVKVVEGRGTCESGFICPFHGWCYGPDGTNTFVPQGEDVRRAQPAAAGPRTSRRCGARCGAGAPGSTSTTTPRRCGSASSRSPPILDAWKVESLRTEWWYACRLPVNWKLAEEAFMEQYHVVETHPQLVIPGGTCRARGAGRPAGLHRCRDPLPAHDERGHGRDGPCQRRAHRRGPAGHGAPADPRRPWPPGTGHSTTPSCAGTGTPGSDIPDLNDLEAQGLNEPMGYCFPHYFVLPMYSSASSYRFRPLGPEETLMEIWSLTRFPEGQRAGQPTPPEAWECDDPRWPPIPAQDFSNLPRQQKGLHAKGFEYMRLSERAEGGISNFERTGRRLPGRTSLREAAPGAAGRQREPPREPVVDIGF